MVKVGGPDDLFEVIRDDGLPVRSHGGRTFNGHDQLLLRHIANFAKYTIRSSRIFTLKGPVI